MSHSSLMSGFHILLQGGPMIWPLFVCAVFALAVILERSYTLRVIATTESRKSLELSGGALQERVLQTSAQMHRHLGILDTVITVAPLLGLLGTVTGMIRAFHVVGGAGNLSASAAITGGVAEALIATALGLVIALVSLVGYNALTGQVVVIEAQMAQRLVASGTPKRHIAPREQKLPKLKKARIEIIPMIDTIFFLLVFFMLTSLSMVRVSSHRVQLPESITAAQKPGDKVVVTLARDGTDYVDEQQVAETAILPIISARVISNPNTIVLINCDRSQPSERFLRALDIIKQANAKTVMIATKPGASQSVPQVINSSAP